MSRKHRKVIDTPSSDSDDSSSSKEEMETINVDFDVKMPEPTDFHGIKNFLHQLFLKEHINTSELANLLIDQGKITSVIKHAYDSDQDMEEEDPEDLDASFGVFSIINLTKNADKECVKQIISYLLSHGKGKLEDGKFQALRRILEDKEKHVGLVISERMINIPPYIAVPLYSNLSKDLSEAKAKGQAFNFDYFLLICKTLVFKEGVKPESVLYTNAEEEIIAEVANVKYDFSVSTQQDSGLSGKWKDNDSEGLRNRKVLLLTASEWELINSKLAEELT